MKIQVDGKTVYELNETKKKVIQNDILSEISNLIWKEEWDILLSINMKDVWKD